MRRQYRVAVAALPPGEGPPPPEPNADEAGAIEVEAPNIAAAAAKAVRREWPGHPHPERIAASARLEDDRGELFERSETPPNRGQRYRVEGAAASPQERTGPRGETDDLGGSPRCFYADSPWEAIIAWGAREPWEETDPLRVVVTLLPE